jgi:hypothetical protein
MFLSPSEVINMPLTERVNAGVDLLDSYLPEWELSVDVDILDIDDMYSCILGQVFGNYEIGKNNLNITFGDEYGFAPFQGEKEDLEDLWVDIIRERQFLSCPV